MRFEGKKIFLVCCILFINIISKWITGTMYVSNSKDAVRAVFLAGMEWMEMIVGWSDLEAQPTDPGSGFDCPHPLPLVPHCLGSSLSQPEQELVRLVRHWIQGRAQTQAQTK